MYSSDDLPERNNEGRGMQSCVPSGFDPTLPILLCLSLHCCQLKWLTNESGTTEPKNRTHHRCLVRRLQGQRHGPKRPQEGRALGRSLCRCFSLRSRPKLPDFAICRDRPSCHTRYIFSYIVVQGGKWREGLGWWKHGLDGGRWGMLGGWGMGDGDGGVGLGLYQ